MEEVTRVLNSSYQATINTYQPLNSLSQTTVEDKINTITLDELYQILKKYTSKAGVPKSLKNMQFDHLAKFITSIVQVYKKRRNNIFAILNKDDRDSDLINNFNANYFREENSNNYDTPFDAEDLN